MPYKHRTDKQAHARQYYKDHDQTIREQAASWYKAHRDDPEIKKKRNERARRWQIENRDRRVYIKKMGDSLKNPLRQIIEDAKKNGCLLCPERHPSCLQFHHRDPSTKTFNIGGYARIVPKKESTIAKYSERLEIEIAKCVVICANCHWKLHAGVIALPDE